MNADSFARDRILPRHRRARAVPTGRRAIAVDRHGRRAVRPPPEVPRPVPRPARQPGSGALPDRGFDVTTVGAGRRRHARRRCSPRRRSRSGRRGAATTASCAGPRSARTRPTAAGRARCASRSSGSRPPSTPSPRDSRPTSWIPRRCGRPATNTSTSSSEPRPPTDFARRCLPTRHRGAASRLPRRCSRPSAGGWRCSPATAGSGTTRSGSRPSRSCCAPRRPSE